MNIFGVKGPALVDAIGALGCYAQHLNDANEYTVTLKSDRFNTIATFDLCPDGAFRFGTVLGVECISWHEFHIELQEATK